MHELVYSGRLVVCMMIQEDIISKKKSWKWQEDMYVAERISECCCIIDLRDGLTLGSKELALSLHSSSIDTELQQLHFLFDVFAAQCNAVILLAWACTLEIVSPDSISYRVNRPSSCPHASVRPSGLQHSAETAALSSKVSRRAQDILCTAMRFSPRTYARRSMVGHHAMMHRVGSVDKDLSSAWTRRKLDMFLNLLLNYTWVPMEKLIQSGSRVKLKWVFMPCRSWMSGCKLVLEPFLSPHKIQFFDQASRAFVSKQSVQSWHPKMYESTVTVTITVTTVSGFWPPCCGLILTRWRLPSHYSHFHNDWFFFSKKRKHSGTQRCRKISNRCISVTGSNVEFFFQARKKTIIMKMRVIVILKMPHENKECLNLSPLFRTHQF